MALLNQLLGDVVGTIQDALGGDGTNTRFGRLYDKSENADDPQGPADKADRRNWAGRKDTSVPAYAFVFKYKDEVTEIPFLIEPESERISEPHAMLIRHGQGGYKIIDSEGMPTKDISISGLSGHYPGGRVGRLPDSGVGSGYEHFLFLQNVMRRYSFLKKYRKFEDDLLLIYINRLRQESWIVEPKVFSSDQSKDTNLMFTYSINLETIKPYEGDEGKGLVEQLFDNPLVKNIDQLFQAVVETIDNINAVAEQISSIVNGFSSRVLSPLVALTNTYARIKRGELSGFKNFNRDALIGTIADIREAHSSLEDAGDDDSAEKLSELERSVIEVINTDFTKNNSEIEVEVASFQDVLSQSYTNANGDIIEASTLTAPPQRPPVEDFFDENGNFQGPEGSFSANIGIDAEASTSEENSIGGGVLSASEDVNFFRTDRVQPDETDGGVIGPSADALLDQQLWNQTDRLHLTNIDPRNVDFAEARINIDDDIQTLAYRLYGDHARYPELIMLNNLEYPYVASKDHIETNNLTNVLAYEDMISYAIPKIGTGVTVSKWRNEDDVSTTLSPFERAFGNDLLMKDGDIVWGANDLQLVYGRDFIQQFIDKRATINRSKNRLTRRRGFSDYRGVSTGVQIALIKAEGASMFSDVDWVESSEVVAVDQESNKLVIQMLVNVKGLSDPLTTRFEA